MAITGADIKVRFGSEGADKVTGDINRLGGAVDSADKKGRGFLGTMTQVAGGFLISNLILKGTGAVIGFGKGLISSSADMEAYRNQLEIATGSQEKANKAFERTRKMAAETPFEFPELIEGVANLEALGMASEEWMPVIADTAAATNKSIDQTVQAVLDASSGEFERLKEFGIRTKVEGDKIKFSFMQNGKEMVVEAENTQEGISNALMGIWDQKYDGAMEKFADSFRGRFSTLVDNIRMRAQDMFQPVFQQISDGIGRINEFFDQVDSEGWGAAFRDLAIDLGSVAVNIGDWIVGQIPNVMDWLADVAVPAMGSGLVALGNIAVNIAGWAIGSIPDIWGWLKEKVAGWLGLNALGSAGSGGGNLIDTLAVSVGEVDFPELGTKLLDGAKKELTDWIGGGDGGTGGIPVDQLAVDVGKIELGDIGSKFMDAAREKITGANTTESEPLDAGTVHAKAEVDISFGDIWGALDAKFREATTFTPEMGAKYESWGYEIGQQIFPALIQGIVSVFTGGGGGGGLEGGGGAGGGATGNQAMTAAFGAFIRGMFSSAVANIDQYIADPLNLARSVIQDQLRSWWNELWTFNFGAGGGGPVGTTLNISTIVMGKIQGISDTIATTLSSAGTIIKDAVTQWWTDLWDFDLDTPDFDVTSFLPDVGFSIDDIPGISEAKSAAQEAWEFLSDPIGWAKKHAGGGDGAGGGASGSTGSAKSGSLSGAADIAGLYGAATTAYSTRLGRGGGSPKMLTVTADTSQAMEALGAVQAALGGLDGASATTYQLGDNSGALAAIAGAEGALGGIAGRIAQTYVNGDNAGALAAVDGAAGALGGIAGRIAQTFVNGDNSSAISSVLEAAGAMAGFDGTTATGYLEAINNVGGAVADAINQLDAFNGRTATAYINVVSSGSASLGGRVPGFAEGGVVTSPLAWVGERGPELVSLPYGSRVHTASQSRQMLAGAGGGDTYHLFEGATFVGTNRDEMNRWAAEEFIPMIERATQQRKIAKGIAA